MLKRAIPVLMSVLCILLLASCASKPVKPPQLPAEFTCQAKVSVQDEQLDCTIIRTQNETTLSLTAPEALNGMTFIFSGNQCSVSYKGLTYGVSDEMLPETAFAGSVAAALNNAVHPENLVYAGRDGDAAVFTGGSDEHAYKIYVDMKSNTIRELELSDLKIKALFSYYK